MSSTSPMCSKFGAYIQEKPLKLAHTEFTRGFYLSLHDRHYLVCQSETALGFNNAGVAHSVGVQRAWQFRYNGSDKK